MFEVLKEDFFFSLKETGHLRPGRIERRNTCTIERFCTESKLIDQVSATSFKDGLQQLLPALSQLNGSWLVKESWDQRRTFSIGAPFNPNPGAERTTRYHIQTYGLTNGVCLSVCVAFKCVCNGVWRRRLTSFFQQSQSMILWVRHGCVLSSVQLFPPHPDAI